MDKLERAKIIANVDYSYVAGNKVYLRFILIILIDIAESLRILANRGVNIGERSESQ